MQMTERDILEDKSLPERLVVICYFVGCAASVADDLDACIRSHACKSCDGVDYASVGVDSGNNEVVGWIAGFDAA